MSRTTSAIILLLFTLQAYALDILKEKSLDIGTYFDDKPLTYFLEFQNYSDSPITNLSFSTSCGCTTLKAKKSEIPPGKRVRVNIESDLTGKRGTITKDVVAKFTHMGKEITKEFILSFKVRKNVAAHGPKKLLKDVLFNENCGKCHAIPAAGKYGEELFKSVCYFCHGINGQGALGISFTNVNYYKTFSTEKIRSVISNGTPGHEMPGFSKIHGGPLDEKQIDSLVDFFKIMKKRIAD